MHREERADMVTFQLREIDDADPSEGEDDALAAQQPYPRTTTAYPKVIPPQQQINGSIMNSFYAGKISAEDRILLVEAYRVEEFEE